MLAAIASYTAAYPSCTGLRPAIPDQAPLPGHQRGQIHGRWHKAVGVEPGPHGTEEPPW